VKTYRKALVDQQKNDARQKNLTYLAIYHNLLLQSMFSNINQASRRWAVVPFAPLRHYAFIS